MVTNTYKRIIENVLAGYWEWNFKTNKVFLSKRFKEVFGYEEDELDDEPETIQSLANKEDLEKFLETVQEHIALGGKKPFSEDLRYYHKNGSIVWVNCTGSILEWDEDQKTAVLAFGCHVNITNIKSREETLNNSFQSILEQNNQLQNFAHIVSHNLRSHSNNIHSLINMIQNAESEHEKKEYSEYLLKASNQLKQTVTDLNAIVDSHKNIEIRDIQIKDFTEDVLSSLISDVKVKEVVLDIDIPQDLSIEYNPAYLESILMNFVTNGIKYKHPSRTPVIKIKAYLENQKVVLEITDNGIGIDLERYGDKLFGMYKTFHGNEDAKGIGLYITRNQIMEMGGRIDVKSVVGEGTTFKVILNKYS
jgi:PAS domain S-box-containing protein